MIRLSIAFPYKAGIIDDLLSGSAVQLLDAVCRVLLSVITTLFAVSACCNITPLPLHVLVSPATQNPNMHVQV